MFPAYGSETETRDGCGAMCANTAGCYFWNWKKSTEQCSLTLGTKPGFKGIKTQTNQNYIGQSLSGSCGGDIKFGTSYQKSSRFYCKFQTPEQNAAFVEDLGNFYQYNYFILPPISINMNLNFQPLTMKR